MAERAQNVVNPTTGEKGSVSEEKLGRAMAAGSRRMTDAESAALIEEQSHKSIKEGFIASKVGEARGFGEAFGIATDPLATSVADLFGKGDETRAYLNELKRWQPTASAMGEMTGQVGGAILGAELTGGGGLATQAPKTALGRIGQTAGSAALRGGLENLVVGTTHDVNEQALGNPNDAGEKIYAGMLKHFTVGAVAGGVLGAAGASLGEAAAALKAPVSEALDRQASAAIGREIGGGLDEGAALRQRMGGVPRSPSQIADFLSNEQAAYRRASQEGALSARSMLDDAHTTSAWQQRAKSEASRLASAREAQAALKAVESRHAAAREALIGEQRSATEAFQKLTAERDAARKQLRNLAGELDKVKGATLPDANAITKAATEGFQPGPQVRALPHNKPSVKPFSAAEIAEHEAELGVTPVRKFDMVPLEHLEAQGAWEPAKLEALRAQLAAGKKLDPVRLTLGGNGKWVIEDGIHRSVIAREMGMTHMPAITTEYIPKGGVSSAPVAMQAGSLTPPSPRAVQLFNEWADNFTQRYTKPGSLTFSELDDVIKSLDVMEKRHRVVSGWGNDPEVKRAFDSMRRAAKAEFDRASEATALSVSEAKGLHASRLRQQVPELDKAVAEAEDNLSQIAKLQKDFERGAVRELQQAEREGFRAMRSNEKLLGKEERALAQQQRAELRTLPKASKATPVDAQLKALQGRGDDGGVGLMSMGGAAVSLLHGNVAGAAMSALGGIAARTARAQGNLVAARTMATLAESIAKADGQIARLAGRAVGRYSRQAADRAIEPEAQKRPRLTFEKAAQRVREAEGNPLIIEQRVRAVAGPWAQNAPAVYSSMLSAAMRSQAFLASKLPPTRTDPYSLTPHLEEDDLSDTEKYDFVQYAKAVADPIGVLKDVADGSVTPQQVEALQAVYPGLYNQMKTEVLRRVADLSEPLDYEKSVNIGTLLNMDTSEVMTAEFQSVLADMYTSREEGEKIDGGSKPLGVNARLSKSVASAGQQMQTGDM